MPSFRESRTVRHAAGNMFELVADFERYPEFAPFCLSARVRKRWSEPSGVEILVADMEVGFGSIGARFATRDRLDRERGEISIVHLHGPFRQFESHWSFRDLPYGGSRIDFSTHYKFSNPAFGALLSPIFGRIVSSMTQAFERRADRLAVRTARLRRAPRPGDAP